MIFIYIQGRQNRILRKGRLRLTQPIRYKKQKKQNYIKKKFVK